MFLCGKTENRPCSTGSCQNVLNNQILCYVLDALIYRKILRLAVLQYNTGVESANCSGQPLTPGCRSETLKGWRVILHHANITTGGYSGVATNYLPSLQVCCFLLNGTRALQLDTEIDVLILFNLNICGNGKKGRKDALFWFQSV